jgi:hypothetical protein
MACASCGQRRAITRDALANLKQGNTAAAKQDMSRFVASMRNDLRGIRSSILSRPPTRPK